MPTIESGKTYHGKERLVKARQHILEQLRRWNDALALNNAEWSEHDAQEARNDDQDR